MNKTIQCILVSLGIFVFIELQVILYVSIDNYIKIHNTDNNQMPSNNMIGPDMNDTFNPFNRDNDDSSSDTSKSNSKRNNTNEKPSI
ncbi:MAG: hypothetical protein K5666_00865 [Bacilli bacterium]|nr:hypothetical protein [Bacilli bacterium]